MERYELKLIDGHLIMQTPAGRMLLDTGAPRSMGTGRAVTLNGRTFPLVEGYMGLSVAGLCDLVGTPFDVLLGADVLGQYDVVFDVRGGSVGFSEAPQEMPADALVLEDVMGVPVVEVRVGGEAIRAFFDTGAKLSYLDAAAAGAFPEAGTAEDFHPLMGRFTTATRDVPMQLGAQRAVVRCGTLPELLQVTLMLCGVRGILGTCVLERCRAVLACRTGRLGLWEWEGQAR